MSSNNYSNAKNMISSKVEYILLKLESNENKNITKKKKYSYYD